MKACRNGNFISISAITDPTSLQDADTELVCHILGPSAAVEISAAGDLLVRKRCLRLFWRKNLSPTFWTAAGLCRTFPRKKASAKTALPKSVSTTMKTLLFCNLNAH